MKIIMPVAGKGSRLRPHTHAIPKALIRVSGKPIISHIIDQIANIDFNEIIFIIGHLGGQIKDFLVDEYDFPMKFIKQKEYNGLGHAIYQAKNQFTEDEKMLVLLGDIIFRADLVKASEPDYNTLGVMEVTEPQKFGIVLTDDNGFITSMVEKPENPPSNLAITGMYYFNSSKNLFDSLEYIIKNNIKTRNEFQLTDAMKNMMENGKKFQVFNVPEWYDCGAKESLLKTNEIMLERFGIYDNIPGNIIIPPVYIGKNSVIENSIVGPNVSVSERSTVKSSIVRDSILGVGSWIENVNIEKSLIGDNASLYGGPNEFNIGPDSEICLVKPD